MNPVQAVGSTTILFVFLLDVALPGCGVRSSPTQRPPAPSSPWQGTNRRDVRPQTGDKVHGLQKKSALETMMGDCRQRMRISAESGFLHSYAADCGNDDPSVDDLNDVIAPPCQIHIVCYEQKGGAIGLVGLTHHFEHRVG